MMGSLRLNEFLHTIADAGLELLRGRLLSSNDNRKSISELCHELLSTLGEASGTAIARNIVDCYLGLNEEEQLDFFKKLLSDFGADHEAVLTASDQFRLTQDEKSLVRLAEAIEPKRQELFRRINMAPNGTATIVKMRRDMLLFAKEYPELKHIDADMKHLYHENYVREGVLAISDKVHKLLPRELRVAS